jgi:Xaa-Pro aminopeptidase
MRNKDVFKRTLAASGVDGILITDLNNLRYLTGFTGSSGLSIITRNRSLFVTDFRYKEQAKMEVKGFSITIERAEKTEIIRNLTKKYGIERLGFEDHSVSYGMYRKLVRKNIRLRALSDTVEKMRLIKNSAELSHIRKAIRRAENAFRKLRPHIKTGITERKLALKLEELLKKEGCKILPFGVIVASGRMSALPHAKPTNRVIKKGDFILFDWGGESGGYFSDMTRTVVIRGQNLNKQLNIYSVVLEAQNRAMKTVRHGARASEIDSAARDYIKLKGYDRYFGHSTGHGVGLEVHEKPVISWQNSNTVEEGMVFTVEPGIYLPGFGGVRIEDIVTVKKNRAEMLTSLPRKLKIIKG